MFSTQCCKVNKWWKSIWSLHFGMNDALVKKGKELIQCSVAQCLASLMRGSFTVYQYISYSPMNLYYSHNISSKKIKVQYQYLPYEMQLLNVLFTVYIHQKSYEMELLLCAFPFKTEQQRLGCLIWLDRQKGDIFIKFRTFLYTLQRQTWKDQWVGFSGM